MDELESDELEIDMTSMIDVTFLLLIFFMVTMTLAQPTEIKLPRSKSGKAETVDGKLIIHIRNGDDSDERLRLGSDEEEAIPISEITSVLQRNNTAVEAIIRADEDVPFAYVNRVADSIREFGLKIVRLGVKERENVR